MPVLMVGPRLASERNCIDSLRLRGYEVHSANSERDGIALYDKVSPEFVLCDYQLGRSDGTDFILSLRRVYGVEEIPVVLVDSGRHEGRRDVARRVGAAGYLVHPIDVRRIEQRIDHLIREPRRRRFTRYASRLPIQLGGTHEASMATALGRGGLFLSTRREIPVESLHECRMTLPEIGRSVTFEAEVLYQRPAAGTDAPGIGVRFQGFETGHERVLLQYLRNIDPPSASL
jgi:two-component system chemotaxis response regulator CheY